MKPEARTQKIRRTTAAERTAMLERYRSSGLSRREFAQKEGIALFKIHRWLASSGRQSLAEEPLFQEVKYLPSLISNSWAVEISHPTGLVIRFRVPRSHFFTS